MRTTKPTKKLAKKLSARKAAMVAKVDLIEWWGRGGGAEGPDAIREQSKLAKKGGLLRLAGQLSKLADAEDRANKAYTAVDKVLG